MKDNTNNAAILSMVQYHFVFCPRYRRKVFLIDGLEARFKELVAQICGQNGIGILGIECRADYCHLFVSAPPDLGPADIMRLIKRQSGPPLKREYLHGKCPQLWTRGYLVSTAASIPDELVNKFVSSQKTRGG